VRNILLIDFDWQVISQMNTDFLIESFVKIRVIRDNSCNS